MYPFLVSVPVPVIIVAWLSSIAVRVAALVWPAFDMDIHHVAFQGGFIHKPFTTVRAEKPFVVFVNCCQMSLEVLDSLPTVLTGFRIVHPDVVLFFFSPQGKHLITLKTGQLTGGQAG